MEFNTAEPDGVYCIPVNLPGSPLVSILLGLAGLADLAMAAVFHARTNRLKRRSEAARSSWLQVPARILYSGVEETRDTESGLTMFSAHFRYSYSVDGKSYEGTQYTMAKTWSSSNRGPHEKEVAEFSKGSEVRAWVNPRDPAEAVLKVDPSAFPDVTVVLVLLILFGLGLVGAAVATGLVRRG